MKGATWAIPLEPWHRIHADFAGPIHGKTVLVVVDAATKWPEVKVMTKTTATATIEVLRTIFSDRGIPCVLVTDNGTQFTSHYMH